LFALSEAYGQAARNGQTITAKYLGNIWKVKILEKDWEKATGNVTLDAKKVEARMKACGLSLKHLQARLTSGASKLNDRTVKTAVDGKDCRITTAGLIAEALGLDDYPELLPGQFADLESAGVQGWENRFGEWQIVKVLSVFRDLSNGLQCELSKATNRLLPNTFGRCKRYNLRLMKTDKRAETETRLVRHPLVCDRLGRHPSFPVNKRADYHSPDYFWIVDLWEEGRTLEDTLQAGPLAPSQLRRTMRELAEGLQALHEREIVRRELTPEFIILREADSSVLLTDLELAKLLDGSPTVSLRWNETPYLAPEVYAGQVDARSDIFSWGQILYHAATGRLPNKMLGPKDLLGLELTPAVKRILSHCVKPMPEDRPKTMTEILEAIRDWK
jgi:serine/threonine protein kinase